MRDKKKGLKEKKRIRRKREREKRREGKKNNEKHSPRLGYILFIHETSK